VLRGASLMTPIAAVARRGEEVLLDRNARVVLTLAADGRPGTVAIGGKPGRVVPFADGDLARLERDVVVTAPPDIKLKSALEIRHKTGNPLALVEDGKLIGVIGDDEIYRGILRQTGLGH
jgi:glycine betaine/proline transport system ATP-binding protein